MLITPSQTVPDAGITAAGTMESLFSILVANGLSITDRLQAGTDIIVPFAITLDTDTLLYLQQNNISIGTADTTIYKGIGFWKVGIDLTVM